MSARPRLAFIVTEDWFFAERFLVMGQVAKRCGYDVYIIARERTHRTMIEAEGFTLIPLEAERRSINPIAFLWAVWRLRGLLKRLRPDVVHCIAIKSIVMGGLASNSAGIEKRIYAPTGLGVFADGTVPLAVWARSLIVWLIRHKLETRRTTYLCENYDDPRAFGLDPADPGKVRIVGGAGIDPANFVPSPLPPLPPLRIAIVSRMLWTKGIDTAVEAVTMARQSGLAVELSLYGAPDDASVQSISESQLRAWSERDGIAWHGATQDVPAVWRAHHVCCVPSRGGEGLPRALLEGAASGRALLTTNVSGCGEFVRHGVDGYVVPPHNAVEMCSAIKTLAKSHEQLEVMAASARQRVLNGYTLSDVAKCVESVYAGKREASSDFLASDR